MFQKKRIFPLNLRYAQNIIWHGEKYVQNRAPVYKYCQISDGASGFIAHTHPGQSRRHGNGAHQQGYAAAIPGRGTYAIPKTLLAVRETTLRSAAVLPQFSQYRRPRMNNRDPPPGPIQIPYRHAGSARKRTGPAYRSITLSHRTPPHHIPGYRRAYGHP